MERHVAILKLKDKKFDLEVLAGIGALADLAYEGLKKEELLAPLDGNQQKTKDALEVIFPYMGASKTTVGSS